METKRHRGAQPGNCNATKNRALREELAVTLESDKGRRLRQGLEAIVDMAASGDLAAMSFIFDRIDGKPRQAVEMSGETMRPVIQMVQKVPR